MDGFFIVLPPLMVVQLLVDEKRHLSPKIYHVVNEYETKLSKFVLCFFWCFSQIMNSFFQVADKTGKHHFK